MKTEPEATSDQHSEEPDLHELVEMESEFGEKSRWVWLVSFSSSVSESG